MELSGAEILIQSIYNHNTDTVFGYPGSCVIQVMDYLYGNKDIKQVLVRHEQGAVHAACGYAGLANKPGVVIVTSGPGATNTLTGIADAFASGIPLIVITGQVSSHLLGTDAFQEADMISVTAPVTKWNYQIHKAAQISDAVTKAFKIATSSRQGPVLLDITKDAQTDRAEYNPFRTSIKTKPLYADIIRTLYSCGKDIVLVVDKSHNDFFHDEFFGSNRVLSSKTFGVSGYGLPAAIGATYAVVNKTICLVAGASEFQTTIKELGVIKQYGLNIKMIILNDSSNNIFEIKTHDLITHAGAYGIKGERINAANDLRGNIEKMLNSAESYLLEISDSII